MVQRSISATRTRYLSSGKQTSNRVSVEQESPIRQRPVHAEESIRGRCVGPNLQLLLGGTTSSPPRRESASTLSGQSLAELRGSPRACRALELTNASDPELTIEGYAKEGCGISNTEGTDKSLPSMEHAVSLGHIDGSCFTSAQQIQQIKPFGVVHAYDSMMNEFRNSQTGVPYQTHIDCFDAEYSSSANGHARAKLEADQVNEAANTVRQLVPHFPSAKSMLNKVETND
eukprot:SAG31_NODE_14964_length_778_cov_0.985272_1_plen_229_part_10